MRLKGIHPLTIIVFIASSCKSDKNKIVKKINSEEYSRLMSLSIDEFDQSPSGFRKYSGDYELIQLLIPQYIKVNEIEDNYSRNLYWHLGQIHAFNENYKAAILEMKKSNKTGSTSWKCYVNGSIAFLKKDKLKLVESIKILSEQENQMNLNILENFLKYFDKSYKEAYNM